MSIRNVDYSVNGSTYSYNTYTAKRGLNILRRLTTIIGPSFGKLVSSTDEIDEDTVDSDFLSDAIKELVLKLDNDEVENLIVEMTREVQKENAPVSFDMEFAGNYGTLMMLLVSIVKENYSSLFTGSGTLGLNQ